MGKSSFVLVSLQEDKAKTLATILSNDSCRKILDFLAEHEGATESEIAKALVLPLSTVHYNLKHLAIGELVSADEFHYSPKGKEVSHYKLANKYIIIAPKQVSGIREKLRSILPAGLVTLAGAGAIQAYQLLSRKAYAAEMLPAIVGEGMMAKEAAADKIVQSAVMPASIEAAVPSVQAAAQEPNLALWFLFGAVTLGVFILILEWLRLKKENAKER